MDAVLCEQTTVSHFLREMSARFDLKAKKRRKEQCFLAALGLWRLGLLWLWARASPAAEYGLWSEHPVAETGRLSCSEARGALVPCPEVEPVSPALEGGFLTIGSPGMS